MKRALRTLAVAAALLCAMALAPLTGARAASAGDFGDVSSGAWYYDAVDFVAKKGLFSGTSPTEFSPKVNMTRGMFITVLGRYVGVDDASWRAGTVTGNDVNLRKGAGTSTDVIGSLDKGDTVTILSKSKNWYQVKAGSKTGYVSADYLKPKYHVFSDVSYDSYYAGYAIWAFEKGIVSGDGSESVFSPNKSVTREQVCTFLNRFADVFGISLADKTGQTAFLDDGSISGWAKDSVYAMQRYGVVEGDKQGDFMPRDPANRAQAAAMFQRFDAACGGYAPPKATEKPKETEKPSATEKPKEDAPKPEEGKDTPVSVLDKKVDIQSDTIRVGVLANNKSMDSTVKKVTLKNVKGSGFEYGSMDGSRRFTAAGSVADSSVTITISGKEFTVTAGGETVYTASGKVAIHPVGADKPITCVDNNDGNSGNDYRYYGSFEMVPAYDKAGYIAVVNYVDIEDYVKGVLPYEFVNSWPAEALKAAAVSARSYVMSYDWSIYSKYGYDIVSGAGTQLYRGRAITYKESYFTATDAAVDATAGQYLTYKGKICIGAFSSCNGGKTCSAKEVYGIDYPYLVSKTDPYEQAAKKDFTVAGGNYEQTVKASHKVGLSAWGAYAMDKYYNKDYKTILGFYYVGTALQYGA